MNNLIVNFLLCVTTEPSLPHHEKCYIYVDRSQWLSSVNSQQLDVCMNTNKWFYTIYLIVNDDEI